MQLIVAFSSNMHQHALAMACVHSCILSATVGYCWGLCCRCCGAAAVAHVGCGSAQHPSPQGSLLPWLHTCDSSRLREGCGEQGLGARWGGETGQGAG
jgi:hypothetical protein